MNGWYKSVPGHELELQFWHGQGGELEDIAVWCHTCDPEGKEVMMREVRYLTALDELEELILRVEGHIGGE